MNQKTHFSAPFQKMAIKCIALILIIAVAALIGIVSATSFTNSATQKNCQTLKVHFVTGSDSQSHPATYPAATVKVASSYTSASAQFSLFPSTSNSSTCYTDLVRIKNLGAACIVNSITISDIVGASNLGNLTIYYYATQTDNPQIGTPIASVSITNSSSGTINLLNSPYKLSAYATTYLEMAGYAAPTAAAGSTIRFTLTFQIEPSKPIKHAVAGDGALLVKHSAGTISGAYGSQVLFRFNVKSDEGNLNGKLVMFLRHCDTKGRMHVYQLTSYSVSSLYVNKSAYPIPDTAYFNMTATIRDITNPCRIITITKNAQVQVAFTDYSNKPDTIAFTVTSPSGQLYFSSSWKDGASVEQSLRCGTLSIS